MDIARLSVELQSFGVGVPSQCFGRKGGAGPSEGHTLIVSGFYINVPTSSWFVKESPYRVMEEPPGYVLYKHGTPVCAVDFPERPAFYDLSTAEGVCFQKIALMHGRDCIASTIYQDCSYARSGIPCSFCGICLSAKDGQTIYEKNAHDIGTAAEKAHHCDGAMHVTLTTGARDDEDTEISHLVECITAIKKRTALPVHIQIMPPSSGDALERLKDAGADGIGLHIETFNEQVLRKVSPAKHRIGYELYRRTWKKAVHVFGHNQVSSFIIAGLGESIDDIVSGAEQLSGIGVYPYILPLRPVPGTPMGSRRPPHPDRMLSAYEQAARILEYRGLKSSTCLAGCVRCGSCSSIRMFEA